MNSSESTCKSTKPWSIKRLFIIFLCLFLFMSVLGVIGGGAFYWRFKAKIPTVDYPHPKDLQQARLQDLDYLLNLPQVDHSFSEHEKNRFNEFVNQLRQRSTGLSEAEFAMEVARAAAISENGHTGVNPYRFVSRMNSLPVRFFWFGDGLHIVRARQAQSELLGARVSLYDGQTPEALVAALDPYHSGTDSFLRYQSPMYFASPEAMRAAGIAGSPDQVSLTLELADGTQREVELSIEVHATRLTWNDEVAIPLPSKQEKESGHEWRLLDYDTVTAAHFAKNPNSTHWHEQLPEGGTYMSIRNTWDAEPLKALLSDVKSQLSVNPAKYLVVDLRSNWGGDYTKTMTFMRNVSELITSDGRVYILTNGGTFSAAIVTSAFALHGANGRGLIVGSRVGDGDQFWAESGASMELPNSGLKVSVTTGYHDWANGCSNWSKCFWLNIVMGVAAGPLDPHIIAPLTYADYSKGIDTTLQAVFAEQGIN